MKNYRAAKVLLIINVLYLHCLPNYCDIKPDVSVLSEDVQTHQVLPSDSSRTGNVPSQQNEAEKVNLGLENLKESVQPNVEYVNSNQVVKEDKTFVNRIGEAEPIYASSEKLKSADASLKSSRHTNQPATQAADTFVKDQAESLSEDVTASKSTQTEPLSSEIVAKSQEKMHPQSEKLTKSTKSPVVESASAQPVIHAKVGELPYATHAESDKIVEDSAHQQYDGMPSFDEWKKMMLAEQEKGGQKVQSPSPPGKKISSQKRRRNYSSYECGAKIVGANPEAEGTSRILNELVDEYMLNPCKTKIWFVIELCETVQASQIELANFELFSSCPKEFSVYSSDNFPTRDWVRLGTFTAVEQRVLQSFELKQEGFGKFIKIELLSHYGEEHYCPLSVVRIFGTSMVDEYEEMETMASHSDIPDDDLDRLDIPIEDKKSTNIFGSATDAVLNIVKKAAQALGQQSVDDKQNDTSSDMQNVSESQICDVIDSSTKKCKDVPNKAKDTVSSLQGFSVSSSSMHQSLFRLLHRCDQCVSSRIRYYSSAQPHCRFFQAAFGPVVFQTLCDWFKEHPLAIAHESPAPGKKDTGGTFVISPTKSPPPQIIRIPSESDLSLKILNDTLSSVSHSDESVTINVTTVPHRVNKSKSVPDKIVLQSSIKPTHTVIRDSSVYNDSIKTSPGGLSEESVVPSADSVNEVLTKASVAIPAKTDETTEEIISETPTVKTVEHTSTNELLSESEEDQITDFFTDSNSVTPEDLSIEIVASTELPPTLKADDDKVGDMRIESLGKVEPIPAATAGQKESVFMRMSNRIKALEINMSLSSQYLQELSQRYRRQMDEMQRAFNRTIGTLNDTARKAAEKDLKQQEILNSLQLQVANLSQTVEFLLSEKSSMFRKMIETHVCLMVIEAIIMITIMSLCVRRISVAKQSSSVERTTVLSPSRLSKRRNSADSCSPPIARKVKKRSSSEENLNAGEDVLIVEPQMVSLDPTLKVKKKNKRRNRGIQRSVSHPAVQSSNSNSLCPGKHHVHSDGCVSIKPKKHQASKFSHACENCDNNICTAVKFPAKERRLNGMPLQNLTNGSVIGPMQDKNSIAKGKDRFSLKKFLKFQKRDSI